MKLSVLTKPEKEVVSTEEAQGFLKVEGSDDYALIEGLIVAARESCEEYQRRAYLKQTFKLTCDSKEFGSSLELPRSGNNCEIVSVKAVENNVETDLDYEFEDDILAKVIIANNDTNSKKINIVYTAGVDELSEVEGLERIKLAILQLVSHWYENRQATVSTKEKVAEMTMGVKYLLNPNKVW